MDKKDIMSALAKMKAKLVQGYEDVKQSTKDAERGLMEPTRQLIFKDKYSKYMQEGMSKDEAISKAYADAEEVANRQLEMVSGGAQVIGSLVPKAILIKGAKFPGVEDWSKSWKHGPSAAEEVAEGLVKEADIKLPDMKDSVKTTKKVLEDLPADHGTHFPEEMSKPTVATIIEEVPAKLDTVFESGSSWGKDLPSAADELMQEAASNKVIDLAKARAKKAMR